MTRSTLVRIAIAFALCHLAALPAAAQSPTAGTFHLDTELYRSAAGAFGDVRLEENGAGGLHFTVTLDPSAVGEDAQLKHVFLSLGGAEGWPAGLEVVPDDPESFFMHLSPQSHGFFSMGANFGAIVSIHERHEHGRGWHRWFRHRHEDDPLLEVGFTLTADVPLTVDDVLAMQSTWRDDMAQIGLYAHHTKLGSRFRTMALLGGLFEADPPPPPPAEEDDTDEDDDGGMGTMPPVDGEIPPGCAGIYDSITGELIMVFCP